MTAVWSRVGDGTLFTIPRPHKPHLWFNPSDDEFARGWWVFDPVNVLPLGPYDWQGARRVARSAWRDVAVRLRDDTPLPD